MRSPSSGDSDRLRYVHLPGEIHDNYAILSGFGVRPALLSEKLCVRRTQVIRMLSAMSTSATLSLITIQSQVATACARSPFIG